MAGGDSAALLEALMTAARGLRRGFAADLEPLGLTPHHARALRVVAGQQPIRLGAIAEALRISPRSVTDVVDALEEAGLVARQPDPGDRRATVVRLTSTGEQRLRETESARRRHAERFAGRLSAAERSELTRLLRLLAEPGRD